MSTTEVRIYANRSAIISCAYQSTYNDHTSVKDWLSGGFNSDPEGYYKSFICGFDFDSLTTAQKLQHITYMQINLRLDKHEWAAGVLGYYNFPLTAWNQDTVIFDDIKEYAKEGTWFYKESLDPGYPSHQTYWDSMTLPLYPSPTDEIIRALINNGVLLKNGYGRIHTSRETNTEKKPYVIFKLENDTENSLVFDSIAPSGGYVPKYEATEFTWSVRPDFISVADLQATNYKFQWRVYGSDTVHEVDCGTDTAYTVPANTFADDEIEWRCVVTDNYNSETDSGWILLSTQEALPETVALAPKNEVVDGTQGVTFMWQHIISTGTTQTAADIQYSTNGVTFTTLGNVSGSSNKYVPAPGTLPAGQVYWRVRTYNTDNVAGAWSAMVSFIQISAPATPIVTATQTPKTYVSWQVVGQQGWQLQVKDANGNLVYDSEAQYGISPSYMVPKYFADGSYTVYVRIQNIYSMWSKYGSAPLNITNTPGADLTLAVAAQDITQLSWGLKNEYSEYLVYRDGVAIARTADNSYVDKYAVGTHTYFVRGVYENSRHYGESNHVEVVIKPTATVIADVDSDVWLDISNSISSLRVISTTLNVEGTLQHYAAAKYPMAELTKFHNKSLSMECAFTDLESEEAFEALIGKTVCVKTVNGDSVVGPLLDVTKSKSAMITSYSFQVSQIDWEEGIDE